MGEGIYAARHKEKRGQKSFPRLEISKQVQSQGPVTRGWGKGRRGSCGQGGQPEPDGCHLPLAGSKGSLDSSIQTQGWGTPRDGGVLSKIVSIYSGR